MHMRKNRYTSALPSNVILAFAYKLSTDCRVHVPDRWLGSEPFYAKFTGFARGGPGDAKLRRAPAGLNMYRLPRLHLAPHPFDHRPTRADIGNFG